MTHPRVTHLALLIATSILALPGCDDDTGSQDCAAEERFDDDLGACVPEEDTRISLDTANVVTDATDDTDAETPDGDTTADDTADAADDATSEDTATEEVEEDVVDPACDFDRDGALSAECGGNDCDDKDFSRAPGKRELCDAIDNDCDEELNDGLDCTFFAHTSSTLYRIDPFTRTASAVTEIPRFSDIDTHPDGTLYGISEDDGFYFFDELRLRWYEVGLFSNVTDRTSGLAINNLGQVFLTAGDSVYQLDLITGQASLIGPLGGDFYSSGDAVVNKNNSLFMTSKAQGQDDSLVLIDSVTGQASLVGVINGFNNIFGLTAAWGTLYGLSSSGEMIVINPTTGEGQLYHTFTDDAGDPLRFFGAASSPGR